MTRPRTAADRFVSEMPAPLRSQLSPLFSPLLEIVPVTGWQDITAEEVAIFTSRNGVVHGPDGNGRTAYCVGVATTAQARDRGWAAQRAGADASDLVATILADAPDRPLVHIRGTHTRGDVAERLAAMGQAVRDCVVYDQRLLPLTQHAQDALTGKTATIVPLFSPRTALQFARQAPSLTSTQVIALSPAVAEAATPLLVDHVCMRPDAAAMYDAMVRAIASG